MRRSAPDGVELGNPVADIPNGNKKPTGALRLHFFERRQLAGAATLELDTILLPVRLLR